MHRFPFLHPASLYMNFQHPTVAQTPTARGKKKTHTPNLSPFFFSLSLPHFFFFLTLYKLIFIMVHNDIKTSIFQTIDALDDQLRDISLKVNDLHCASSSIHHFISLLCRFMMILNWGRKNTTHISSWRRTSSRKDSMWSTMPPGWKQRLLPSSPMDPGAVLAFAVNTMPSLGKF